MTRVTAEMTTGLVRVSSVPILSFDGSKVPNNTLINFADRETVGDGCGGQLRFLKGSTATADGVTAYAVTGGRLVRENWLATGVNILWAGAKVDATDNKAAIDRALNSYITVNVPFGTFKSSGGHNLQGKSLIGINRDVSIIKATGTNSGVTLFTGGQTNPSSPGTWGSGGAFRLENLGIYGNWDGTSGLTLVGNYKVGVLAANYNATLNTALVKGVSTVYTFIKNCQFAYAYEHALMFYGNGYSTVGDNIFTTCRGSGTWFAGDKSTPESTAASTATSTIYRENKVTTCRGGLGGLVMNLIYGCTIRDNLFEANYYGYALYENADCKFGGNYVELGYIVGDNVGPAPVYVDPSAWGTTFDDIYNPIGNYVPDNVRSAVVMDRSGIRLKGTPGYGGVGIQFPAVQAPSADANTLDDYEEGTWTPVGNTISFTAASGKYTKIGNLATLSFSVTFPVTADGSIAYIAGSPFVPAFDAGVALASAGGRATVDFTYRASAGNTFLQPVNAAGTAFMTNANFSGGVLAGTVTFHT